MKLFLIAAVVPALAFAELDRSLMSDAYWSIWNDAEQARIDADIEKNRKVDGASQHGRQVGAGRKAAQARPRGGLDSSAPPDS